jgi:ribosome recycling factor
MKTANEVVLASISDRIERNLKRLDKIHDEYESMIDKLIAKRNKELAIYWELIDQDRKKLQEVQS